MPKLLLLLLLIALVSAKSRNNRVTKRAFRYQNVMSFTEIFSKYNYPSDTLRGKTLYDSIKQPNFESGGTASLLVNSDKEKILQLPNLLRKQDLISVEEYSNLHEIFHGPSCKTIRESVFVQANGDFIYGLVGVNKLNDSIAVLISFQNHRFVSKPIASLKPEGKCSFWGIVCENQLNLSLPKENFSVSSTDGAALLLYFRKMALDSFKTKTVPAMEELIKYSNSYKKYLPQEIKDDLENIGANPNQQPDKIIHEDPLRNELYLAILSS